MKKEVFDKMLNSGEFEQMFNENKINDLLKDGSLSKEQIDKLVDLGKKMSKEEILRRQRDLAKQPGYKEHVLTPLIKKIIAQQGRARDPITGKYIKQEAVKQQKAEEQPQEQPQEEKPNAEKTAEKAEQMGQKFKPKRMKNMFSGSRGASAKPATSKVNMELYSKIGVVENPRLLRGDNVATVASKLYSIMKNDIEEYNVRSKLERKRDNQYLDNEVRRHNEIITALNKAGTGPSVPLTTTTTSTGMGMGTKLAVGAGLIGAAGLAAAAEKPVPKVQTPAATPVEPSVNIDNEVRKKQLEAEREAAATQEKQKREQQDKARQEEQSRLAAQQKQAAEEKAAKVEADKKAAAEQKSAKDEETRKQKEQEEEDKRNAAEAKAKSERDEKERKALELEAKRKKDAADKIAKAEAEGQKRETERLRREEEKTAREESARIKKEKEDAEKEADVRKREAALQRKKQAEVIAAEVEKRIAPKEFKFKTGTQVGNYVNVPKPTAKKIEEPDVLPAPSPVTKMDETPKKESTSTKISKRIAEAESAEGSYFVANLGSLDRQVDGVWSNIILKGNIDITTATWDPNIDNGKKRAKGNWIGGKKFKKDLTEMTLGEVMDLQNRRSALFKKSSGGSAVGKFQFVRSTLEATATDLYGTGWRNIIFDESAQDELQAQLLYKNAALLKKYGTNISEISLYLSHWAGPFPASKILKADANEKIFKYLTPNQIDANDWVKADTTVGEFLTRLLKGRFSSKTVNLDELDKPLENPKQTHRNIIAPNGIKIGSMINDSSIRNLALKSGSSPTTIIINNGTTVLGSNNPRSGLSIPTSPDNSAYYPYSV